MWNSQSASLRQPESQLGTQDTHIELTGLPKNIESSKTRRQDFENQLDKALKDGDIDTITDIVTPRGLGNCNVNCLEKSMEVSRILYKLGKEKGPDAEDLIALGRSVEDFTVKLIEPLKGDDIKRAIFGGKDFDRITNKAIWCEQKKLLSHTVVHNLLMRRWSGSYWNIRYSAWMAASSWLWILLNLWTIFDLVLFPLVFLVFFVIHRIMGLCKRRKDYDHRVIFLLNSSCSNEDTVRIIQSVTEMVSKELKPLKGKYAAVSNNGQAPESVEFKEGDEFIKELVERKQAPSGNDDSGILSALEKAAQIFEKTCENQNKAVVVLTDKRYGVENDKLFEVKKSLKHVRIIAAAVGTNSDLEELNNIATSKNDIVLLKDWDDIRKFSERINNKIFGQDIYGHYLQYFNTPYFIFVRDTLSYLILLGLHFVICLQPTALYFTPIEWIILLFFLGRLMMEIYQIVTICTSSYWDEERSQEKDDKNTATLNENDNEYGQQDDSSTTKMKKKLSKIIRRYFRDWWNRLDTITLVFYTVLLVLRAISDSLRGPVSQNRLLAMAGYLYGLNAMLLTLRAFGHIMETMQNTGTVQIALIQVIDEVGAIFGQFCGALLAFSMAITKIYMVQLSYRPASNTTADGLCIEQGIPCWWRATGNLAWSLLGLGDLELMKSSDVVSDTFARILYSVFLVIAVVMLMNLMIALLSNTYQQIEDNAFHEWSYKKAITIRTYSNYHPIPVPFNIISLTAKLICFVCMTVIRICFPNGNSKAPKESNQIFYELLKHLKEEYFSKYGYSFPMKDDAKMDLVMKETEGNNQIVGHIAQRVFRDDWEESEQAYPKAEWKAKGIRIEGNQLSYLGKSSDDTTYTRYGARYKRPISKELPGFEVLIQDCRKRTLIAIGLVCEDYDLNSFPGRKRNTIGYHIEQGRIFGSINTMNGSGDDAIPGHRGDLIGCFVGDTTGDDEVPVSFTLNGSEIGKARVEQTAYREGKMFPCVALGAKNIKVIVKMRHASVLSSTDPPLSKLMEIPSRLNDIDRKLELFGKMITSLLERANDRDKRMQPASALPFLDTPSASKLHEISTRLDSFDRKFESLEKNIALLLESASHKNTKIPSDGDLSSKDTPSSKLQEFQTCAWV